MNLKVASWRILRNEGDKIKKAIKSIQVYPLRKHQMKLLLKQPSMWVVCTYLNFFLSWTALQ